MGWLVRMVLSAREEEEEDEAEDEEEEEQEEEQEEEEGLKMRRRDMFWRRFAMPARENNIESK